MDSITEAERQTLEDGLDTTAILQTVDAISRLRAELAADGDTGDPPTIRDELLELHRLALAVREGGTSGQLAEFFDLANDLEFQVGEWMQTLAAIHNTLSAVTALYPESLAYEGIGESER